MSWPEAEGTAEESEGSRILPSPTVSRVTVLLAEDDPAVLKITTRTLEYAGYEVLGAPDVDAALRLAEHHDGAIDVLLTDVLMPGMNGPELAAAVRQARPDIKVLFVSGFVDAHNQALMDDDVPLLGKPFTRRQLLSYLETNLAT